MNIVGILIMVAGLIAGAASCASAEDSRYISIIPTFHNRMGDAGKQNQLQLLRQDFLLFVYRNAVVVHSSAQFVNTGTAAFEQEFSLPSTGHDENASASGGRISNGILGVRLDVEGERVAPKVNRLGNDEWYTIRAKMEPEVPDRIEALFWAQTSLDDVDSLPGLDRPIAPGRRGFLIDLAHARAWNDVIRLVTVTVILREGLSVERDSFEISPDTYESADSTLSWTFTNIDPSAGDNIEISYDASAPKGGPPVTMAGLGAFIVTKAYDEILHLVRAR